MFNRLPSSAFAFALLGAALFVAPSAQAVDWGGLQNKLGNAAEQLQGSPKSSAGQSAGVAALSTGDVSQGLKAALTRGAELAVQDLGRPNGFYGNPKWRIPLPPVLKQASSAMRLVGKGQQAEQLEQAINQAAETAVPKAKDLLVGAVKRLTLEDAKGILTGGDEAATHYLRSKTQAPLTQDLLPIVTHATEQVGLARQYNQFAGQAASLKLLSPKQANIQQYVTEATLQRLYQAIGEQERAIRAHPLDTGSSLIAKVFGAASGR